MLGIKSVKNKIKSMKEFIKRITRTITIIWKSSRISAVISLVATIFNGAIIPINMLIGKYFIDSVINALNNRNNYEFRNEVFIWLGLEFGVAILSYVINRLSRYFYDIQIKTLNIYISGLLIEKSNKLDISYFEDSEFYNKIEKANNESLSSVMGIMSALIEIVKNCSSLVGSIIIVIKLNPLILFLCIVTTIPMFYINVTVSKWKYDVYNKRIEESRFASYLQRLLMHYNNIKEIKLNRLGNYFENIIISTYKKHINQDKFIGKKQFKRLTAADCLNSIISYCYKLYVVFLTLNKGLTIGSMTMYISALTNVDNSVKNTLDNFTLLYSNNLYIENLFSVLELEPRIIDKGGEKTFNKKEINLIEFRNVSFKYPNTDRYILKDINLTIRGNQTCAIVGLNGSGKTTLIKLMTRLYDPTEGDILIDGINIKEYSLESLYKNIGVVFQDFMKYPFTVKENIGFGNIEDIEKMELIDLAARKSNAYDFIQKLDEKYDTKLEKLWTNGVDLSLGQWQKLAISRAFVSDAAILILDEPTASLDAVAEYELYKNFKELIGSSTSILISHRFSTVKMSDVIYVIEDGMITEAGTHEDLMLNNGLYAKLYIMQAESYQLPGRVEQKNKKAREKIDIVASDGSVIMIG